MDDYRKWVLLLNTNVFYASKSNKWEDFLYYLGIGVVDNEEDNIHRLTPTDTFVGYAKDSDEEVQMIMNHYNGRLNKDYPFEYPDNWFKVIKELMKYRGGLVGVSGEVIAAYMFAAPRTYLKYFTSDKSDKQIAEDIYYDNL